MTVLSALLPSPPSKCGARGSPEYEPILSNVDRRIYFV